MWKIIKYLILAGVGLFVFLLISSPSDTYKPGDYIGKSDWWEKAWEFFLSFYFFCKKIIELPLDSMYPPLRKFPKKFSWSGGLPQLDVFEENNLI